MKCFSLFNVNFSSFFKNTNKKVTSDDKLKVINSINEAIDYDNAKEIVLEHLETLATHRLQPGRSSFFFKFLPHSNSPLPHSLQNALKILLVKKYSTQGHNNKLAELSTNNIIQLMAKELDELCRDFKNTKATDHTNPSTSKYIEYIQSESKNLANADPEKLANCTGTNFFEHIIKVKNQQSLVNGWFGADYQSIIIKESKNSQIKEPTVNNNGLGELNRKFKEVLITACKNSPQLAQLLSDILNKDFKLLNLLQQAYNENPEIFDQILNDRLKTDNLRKDQETPAIKPYQLSKELILSFKDDHSNLDSKIKQTFGEAYQLGAGRPAKLNNWPQDNCNEPGLNIEPLIVNQEILNRLKKNEKGSLIKFKQDFPNKELSTKQREAIEYVNGLNFANNGHRDQLIARIKSPELINQGKYGVCGVVVIMQIIAGKYPKIYAQMIYNLITFKKSVFPFKIELRDNGKDISERDIDEILLTSMRNSENSVFPLKTANNLADIAGATLPGEIVNWLKTLIENDKPNSSNNIENTMEVMKNKSQDDKMRELENLANKFAKLNNGEMPSVIMYCDNELSDLFVASYEKEERFLKFNFYRHYVLVNNIVMKDGKVIISVNTWGYKCEVDLDENKFLKGYRGYIAATLPDSIEPKQVQ